MRKLQIIFLTLVLVLGIQVVAQAALLLPALEVKIGENTKSFELNRTETGWALPKTSWETGDGSVSVELSTKTDPFIVMAVGAVNFTAGPLGYAFSLAVPIALPCPLTAVSASLVGGLTDSLGDGVAIVPFLSPTILENLLVPPGAAWGTGPAAAFGPGVPGAFYVYGPSAFGPAAGPPGPGAALFSETISFFLSGGFDAAALTGFCDINCVPVPPTLVLMGSGLLGLVGLWRWRKS
jgi:hypothetical protein